MRVWTSCVAATLLVAAVGGSAASGELITLGAATDNTLYEDLFGGTSNGAGDYFFAGTTNSDKRRGLIRFDLASIPSSATINSVSLKLHMSRTTAGAQTVTLHRLLNSWGEGASDAEGQEGGGITAEPGDATWLHRFYNTTPWSTPGGDFSATASASRSVGGFGFYTWTSPTLISDVQAWLNGSLQNDGWLVRGNESILHTAKRFDTRENPDPTVRPQLIVDFTRIPEPGTLLAMVAAGALALRRRG